MPDDDTEKPYVEGHPNGDPNESWQDQGPKGEAAGQAQPKEEPEQPSPAPDTDTVASPQYRDALQHELDAIKQRGEDRKQWVQEQQWAHQQMQKIMSQPMPQMPSFDELYGQQQPPPQKQSPAGAMAAYAAIALPLAFAFGRKGPAAWGAMRGIAEGLSSIKHGYDDRARQSAAVWKAQNDLAIRMGEKKMEYYKDIIANRKMDMGQKMQMISSMADFFHDRDLSEQAEIGDWDKAIKILHQYDTVLSNAKKVRLQHEGDIMNHLGSDKEHKEYLSELIRRDPEFRKAALSRDNQKISDAYDKAVARYPYSEFHKEYEARAGEEEEQKEYHREKGKLRAQGKDKTNSNPLGLNLGEDTSANADENVQLPTDIP